MRISRLIAELLRAVGWKFWRRLSSDELKVVARWLDEVADEEWARQLRPSMDRVLSYKAKGVPLLADMEPIEAVGPSGSDQFEPMGQQFNLTMGGGIRIIGENIDEGPCSTTESADVS